MEALGPLLLPAMAIILIAFMFWSQRRRQHAVAELQESLAVGDDVCTTSGLFGRITGLDDVAVTLEVAPGTRVRFDRRAVAAKVDAAGRPVTGSTRHPAAPAERPADGTPGIPKDDPTPDSEK